MFKYAQILGSILRSFPLALAAEIVPKKVEWNDSLKNLVY
jgi:hypothetical protein